MKYLTFLLETPVMYVVVVVLDVFVWKVRLLFT